MHPKHCTRRLLLGLLVLTLMVGGPAMAQPVDNSGTVIVPIGGAVRLQMKTKLKIKRADIENPSVAAWEPDAANPLFVILRGLKQGTTRLEMQDDAGNKETYVIVVQTDLELLRNILKRAVPTANVDVIPFGTGVVLTGNVARADDADTVVRITANVLGSMPANVINAMTIGGVQQVQLDVIVARVDRTKSRSRGFNFVVSGQTVQGGSILGGLSAASGTSGALPMAGTGITSGVVQALPTGASNLVLGIVPAQLQMLMQALTAEGLAKLIAEPKLVTQSGRPAHFLSGGQQAIVGPSAGITGPGVVLQPFGTTLDFLPIVYGNGKIYLEINTEVTAVDAGLGLAATSTLPATPGFDDQSVKTSVVLESGQTFAIGGLIQTTVQAASSRVPVLGEIPFIAPFFSVQTDTLTEQELVIMVTPHLVDPMDCSQVPRRLPGLESRAPDDFEFYLEGILELPRGQRNVFENKCYKGAWKNDPSAGSFPCATWNPSACLKGGGGCANGNCASCANGSCSAGIGGPVRPADNAPTNLKSPAELPPASSIPMNFPVPSKGQ